MVYYYNNIVRWSAPTDLVVATIDRSFGLVMSQNSLGHQDHPLLAWINRFCHCIWPISLSSGCLYLAKSLKSPRFLNWPNTKVVNWQYLQFGQIQMPGYCILAKNLGLKSPHQNRSRPYYKGSWFGQPTPN